MRIVNLAHGDLAVCGAYLGLVLSSALGVPVWVTLPLLLPAAFAAGLLLQALLFGRALRHGVLAPVLVTFGLSVMIENLLQEAATSDPRGLNGGSLILASFRIGSQITVSWLFMTAFLTACAVLSGLQLLLTRTSWGRQVRATADDLDTARLVGIRVRPLFATVAGLAVATAALAGVFIGTIGTFDPFQGANSLIFAFEAVVIGGLGSLWGTLVGGMALGVTQVVVGQVNEAYAVLAVHLLFLAVLAVRPGGLFTGHQAPAQRMGALG
jgi:branched-chain amino acid transport system permease protein